MRFRPCIDIHNGSVKQIVGGTLRDTGNSAVDNFVSEKSGAFYAELYKELGLSGGHIIILNPKASQYYQKDVEQALSALHAWPGGLQIGGGINPENAGFFLDEGASHVIVTSYVFKDGNINRENLQKILQAVGRKRLVLDLSCRKKDGSYYIVTDRWQKFTNYILTGELLNSLTAFCDEFLIHAVDAEGKASGIEEDLLKLMTCVDGFPITYAGGVGSLEHLRTLKALGSSRIDVTIGSALDMFGGHLSLKEVLDICSQ